MLRSAVLSMLVLNCAALSSCKSFNLKKDIPWDTDTDVPAKQVTRMVTSWKDSTVYSARKYPERGFGGRIYFYNRNGDPVKAEGKLVVYAYDESQPREINQVPHRRYVFTSDQLQSHFSESSIGPSYSVWLPWDGVGGPPTKVNLVPTFLPAVGQVVVGQEVRQHLPGSDALASPSQQRRQRQIRRASYEDGQSQRPLKQGWETTIPLPATSRSMLRRGDRPEQRNQPESNGLPLRNQLDMYRAAMEQINGAVRHSNTTTPLSTSSVAGRFTSPASAHLNSQRSPRFVQHSHRGSSSQASQPPDDPQHLSRFPAVQQVGSQNDQVPRPVKW